MKRIPRARKRLATTRTTSTTGPHVLLVQNFGVAKTTTNGRWAAMLCATEYRRRSRSGGVLVVSRAKLPCVLAIVGVCDGYARAPTAGDALLVGIAVSLLVNDAPSDVAAGGAICYGVLWTWERVRSQTRAAQATFRLSRRCAAQP